MKPVALVLGSAGLLGSVLVKKFATTYEVVGWDKNEIDITDRVACEKIVTLHPSVILNAVAYNNVDEAEQKPEAFALAQKINGDAVLHLVEVSKKINAPLVHFSTDYVFAGTELGGYTENSRPAPINKYGETKLAGEKHIARALAAGGQCYLVRLSRLFGPTGSGTLSKKSFVDLIIEKAQKQGNEPLTMVDDEVSCPTYSVDVADLVFGLLQNKIRPGVYHGANSGAVSWYTMAQKIMAIKKINVNLLPVKSASFVRAARRPLFSALVNTKLPAQRSWQSALEDYLS